MNSVFITALIGLLGNLIPAVSANAPVIANAVTVLEELVPLIITEYNALVPMVKDIIAALQSSADITDAQMAQLDVLNTQCDAGFEAEATAAGFPTPTAN